MGYFLLGLALVAVFVITLLLLRKYTAIRKQDSLFLVSTFAGWYFSFIIIFVLPLDVSSTFHQQCLADHSSVRSETNETVECEEPPGYVPEDVLYSTWRIVYWSTQILTWVILPIVQSYAVAGDFTAFGRFKSALINNAIYYGIYLGVFVFLLVYAILKGVVINMESLEVLLVSASNTWGLFLLVVLLGYGLVELPRQLWCMSVISYRLNKLYFTIDKLYSDKNDAEETLREVYKEARSVLNGLKNDHGRREMVQVVMGHFPPDIGSSLFPSRRAADFSSLSENEVHAISEKYLVSLHVRVIDAVHSHHLTTTQWNAKVQEALSLEDGGKGGRAYVWGYKAVCMVCGAMSVLIIVSECTFSVVRFTLSPSALLVEYTINNSHYVITQLICILLLLYICACAYLTVFRLRFFKYYHLDVNGSTDVSSLLFSAMLLCRLTPPICLNFLGLVHLDSHIISLKNLSVETQFTKLMGHLDVIPLLAKGINIYLPIFILIFCAMTYFRLGTHLMHALGVEQFIEEDELTMDAVSAGKSLIVLERNKVRREERRRGTTFDRMRQNRDIEARPIIDEMEGDSPDNTNRLFDNM